MKIIFAHPVYLWMLLLLPILVLAHLFVFRIKKHMALKFSNFGALEKVAKKSFVAYHRGFITKRTIVLLSLRTLTYSMFILAVSGLIIEYSEKTSNFNFVLAIDSSSSMIADDFSPNRLEAAKEAALLFTDSIGKQTSMGIVSFAGDVSVILKPTKNKLKIQSKIKEISLSDTGGTNIGDALITSGNLFEGTNPRRIILLTDGQANIGPQPEEALGYIKSKNMTVYAIGVATQEGGKAESGFVSRLDEETLKTVAEQTNGKYYRAENKDLLKGVFEEIASLTINRVSLDISWVLLLMGFLFLALGWLLATTKYRVLP